MKIKVICGAVVVKDNKFVIVQEAQGLVRGLWNIPAGHLDDEEDLKSAAVREVKEETGLDVKLEGLIGIYQHKSLHGNNVVGFYFKASVLGGELLINPVEILDSKWVTFEEFLNYPENIVRALLLKTVIKDYLDHGSVDNRINSGIN
ncbi:MAG: NUDIX domain-containing protein [Patescibacteria group bacterium]|jgi:8-oxo-dGTP pyrophosphatase MutT (NUDIX family)